MRVYFCVRGGGSYGIGHVKRALAIAGYLREKKFADVSFFVEGPSEILKMVEEQSFRSVPEDVIFSARDAVVMIDRKDDVTSEIQRLKTSDVKVCLIDNITEARFLADLVIYPLSHLQGDIDWDGFKGRKLEGAEYFPLSTEFAAFRKPVYESGGNILVSMGGSDFNNLTARTLNALRNIKHGVDVVIGPVFKFKDEVERLKKGLGQNFRFHYDVSTLAPLMAGASTAITAFGTTLYELAYMGVPAIIINNYREDSPDVEIFSSFGTAIPLGYFKEVSERLIEGAVESLVEDRSRSKAMSDNGRALVDGRGCERIALALKALSGVNAISKVEK